jgi:Flp pilus assembly protein TadG
MMGFWKTRRNRIAASETGARRSLLRDDSGATILEFTIVAAPFLALILANLETSIMLFTQQVLDTTTEKIARRLMTGQVQSADTSQADFKQEVCDDLPSFMACNRVMVSVQKAADFNSANTGAPVITFNSHGQVTNHWDYDFGDPGDIVIMKAFYRWPAVSGPLGFNLANLSNGDRLLMSTAIFKAERYTQ